MLGGWRVQTSRCSSGGSTLCLALVVVRSRGYSCVDTAGHQPPWRSRVKKTRAVHRSSSNNRAIIPYCCATIDSMRVKHCWQLLLEKHCCKSIGGESGKTWNQWAANPNWPLERWVFRGAFDGWLIFSSLYLNSFLTTGAVHSWGPSSRTKQEIALHQCEISFKLIAV